MKAIILLLLLMPLFTGCDPGYSYTEEITNNSTETIDFYLASGSGASMMVDSTIHLLPGTIAVVHQQGGLGNAENIICGSDFMGYTITVKTTHQKMLLKDVTDPNNWTSTFRKRTASTEKHCFLEINDADLQ
ncbi:MAG: hypothetical protein ABIO24_07075 [Saprospiraceae bacterium]